MKSLLKGQRLKNRQIVDLAGSLSTEHLKDLAVEFMGFSHETVQSILAVNEEDQESFKREIITKWANMNSKNQVQVTHDFESFNSIRQSQEIILCI